MNDVLSQLQKVGSWLWLQKEKLVLLALVVILFYQVYVVLQPPPPPKEDTVQVAQVTPVPAPPPFPPARPLPADTMALVARNPFTIYGVQQETSSRTQETEAKLPITLQRIITGRDGSLRAMLAVGTDRARLYKEGEPFQKYRLESIDQGSNSVVVYSQEHDRSFTIQAQGGG